MRPGGGGEHEALSCVDALARLYEYLDGELDDVSREEVAAHFDACRRCYPHLACERAFKTALRRAVEGRRAPPDLRKRVIHLLEGAVEGG